MKTEILSKQPRPPLYLLHQAQAFFVTRAKSNTRLHRIYSVPVDRSTGLICDQTIARTGTTSHKDYPNHLRRIRFKDPKTGKTLVFLTNNFAVPAATICALYKARWQVELFFKWIKQHLRIKKFYGNSENAVKSQLWIAVSVYVLVAIVKKRLALHVATDIVGHPVREVALAASVSWQRPHIRTEQRLQPTESIRVLTGHFWPEIQKEVSFILSDLSKIDFPYYQSRSARGIGQLFFGELF